MINRSLAVVVVTFAASTWVVHSTHCAVVEYRLEAANSEGSPVAFVPVDGEFQLRVWVADVRPNPTGVVSAYLDVEYDATRLGVVPDSLEHGSAFGSVVRGDLSNPPILDEFGSFRRSAPEDPMLPQPSAEVESLLFAIRFNANRPGYASFVSNPADIQPRHATTVFGLDSSVPVEDMIFDEIELLILPETCDFDDDTLCHVSDIDLLNSAGDLVAGVPAAQTDLIFDLDMNDIVNREDVSLWLATAAIENGFDRPYLRGDANLDGTVDAADLNALALNWRQESPQWSAGDTNGDGSVDAIDLNQLALNWRGTILAAAASPADTISVPEPNALFLSIACFLIFAGKGGRRGCKGFRCRDPGPTAPDGLAI